MIYAIFFCSCYSKEKWGNGLLWIPLFRSNLYSHALIWKERRHSLSNYGGKLMKLILTQVYSLHNKSILQHNICILNQRLNQYFVSFIWNIRLRKIIKYTQWSLFYKEHCLLSICKDIETRRKYHINLNAVKLREFFLPMTSSFITALTNVFVLIVWLIQIFSSSFRRLII